MIPKPTLEQYPSKDGEGSLALRWHNGYEEMGIHQLWNTTEGGDQSLSAEQHTAIDKLIEGFIDWVNEVYECR